MQKVEREASREVQSVQLERDADQAQFKVQVRKMKEDFDLEKLRMREMYDEAVRGREAEIKVALQRVEQAHREELGRVQREMRQEFDHTRER